MLKTPPKNHSKQLDHTLPDIVLVHGFRGSPIGLEAIGKELEQNGYKVHIPPIPPFGGATKLKKYTPEAYSKYLVDYFDEHDIFKPVLIGHSMGSIIVSATLNLYPEHVHHKSVLLSPISNRTAPPFRLITPLSAVLPRRTIDYITTRFLFIPRDRALLHQVLEITHDCSNDRPPLRSEVLSAANFSTKYCVGDFHADQDLLLLAGEKDRLISQKQTMKLAKKLHSDLDFLPNCGHLHNYEDPHATAQKILDFLQKL